MIGISQEHLKAWGLLVRSRILGKDGGRREARVSARVQCPRILGYTRAPNVDKHLHCLGNHLE